MNEIKNDNQKYVDVETLRLQVRQAQDGYQKTLRDQKAQELRARIAMIALAIPMV